MGTRMLREKEVQDRTALSRSARYRLMAAGKFPRPVHLYPGSRAVGWIEAEIDEWLEGRVAEREAA
jgi:prophage regulatory protein